MPIYKRHLYLEWKLLYEKYIFNKNSMKILASCQLPVATLNMFISLAAVTVYSLRIPMKPIGTNFVVFEFV